MQESRRSGCSKEDQIDERRVEGKQKEIWVSRKTKMRYRGEVDKSESVGKTVGNKLFSGPEQLTV